MSNKAHFEVWSPMTPLALARCRCKEDYYCTEAQRKSENPTCDELKRCKLWLLTSFDRIATKIKQERRYRRCRAQGPITVTLSVKEG